MFRCQPSYGSKQIITEDYARSLIGPNVHDSAPRGLNELAHRVHTEGCSLSTKQGPEIPCSRVQYVVAMTVWSQELSPLPPTDRLPCLSDKTASLGDGVVDGEAEHKHRKTRNRLRGKVFMVSPAGFEPATTRIRRTTLVTRGIDALESSSINEFRVSFVYLVNPKIPVPSLRGEAVVTDTIREHRVVPFIRGHLMATQSLDLFYTNLQLPSLTIAHRVGHVNFRVLSCCGVVDRWVPSHRIPFGDDPRVPAIVPHGCEGSLSLMALHTCCYTRRER